MLGNIFIKPEILDKVKHKDIKVSSIKDYSFTKDVYLSPISLDEMILASKSFIIVFVKDENNHIFPSVILGAEQGENLFLNKDNSWKEGIYIPAALRCYPFGLGSDNNNTYITIDVDADVFKSNDGQLIVQDEKKFTEYGYHAVSFVTNVYAGIHNANAFTKLIDELNIFTQAEISIEINEEKFTVKSGVYVINEVLLNKLEPRKLKKLMTSGYMKFIYMHLLSLANKY